MNDTLIFYVCAAVFVAAIFYAVYKGRSKPLVEAARTLVGGPIQDAQPAITAFFNEIEARAKTLAAEAFAKDLAERAAAEKKAQMQAAFQSQPTDPKAPAAK